MAHALLGPIALAALAGVSVLTTEALRPNPGNQPSGSAPAVAIAVTPAWHADMVSATAVEGSRAIFRIGQGSQAPTASTQRVHGEVTCDDRGIPARLRLRVDLAGMQAEAAADHEAVRSLLGSQRDPQLQFEGLRRQLRTDALTGVVDLTFAGVMRFGRITRRVEITLDAVSLRPGRVHMVGRGQVLGSHYGLPQRFAWLPFSSERELDVMWDLVFESSPG